MHDLVMGANPLEFDGFGKENGEIKMSESACICILSCQTDLRNADSDILQDIINRPLNSRPRKYTGPVKAP
jgi:hypothetical protein